MKKYLKQFATLTFIIIAFTTCDKDRNHPGYSYFPDMANSRAYETYSVNPNFADSATARTPVLGTIPRGTIPYLLEKSDENRTLAGVSMQNPYKPKEGTLDRGKERYEIFCINCHGEKGDGKGYLVSSGRYPYQAANLLSDKMKKAPDGEIFHVISVGWGVMGAHASQVSQKDRWRIASYIKNMLQKEE